MPQFKPALLTLGFILVSLSILMLLPVLVTDIPSNRGAFLWSAALTVLVGMLLVRRNWMSFEALGTREVFLITVISWLGICAFASLPLLFSDLDLSLTDAVFETVSGITTTGATVLAGLDSTGRGILLWRAILQWMGGIGIIGMAVAVLPFLRVGGMRLFKTESSEWTDKAMPRSGKLVRALVYVYLVLTAACCLAYWLAGMGLFDAVCHAMTTVATAGYSTHDASLGYFESPVIHWLAIAFMFLGGLPFVLYVRFWSRMEGRVFNQKQVRGFIAILVAAILLLALHLMINLDYAGFEALTLSAFNVTSIVTTTGYATTDYSTWGAVAIPAFFFLMFIGGCSGSTTGGMKVFRFQLSFMLLREQIRKLVHPHAVISRRYGDAVVSDEIIASAIAFTFLFFIMLAVLAVSLALMGLDTITSLTGALSALSNVGPGLGEIIGPAGNFSTLPGAAKWLLSAGMILGRLELVVVIVVFTRSFWRG